jgi:hypothetical protein
MAGGESQIINGLNHDWRVNSIPVMETTSILSNHSLGLYQREIRRFDAVQDLLSRTDCTYVGVGPMSKNCVDAAIEIVNEYEIPLILIASRRQIECRELGGGYVNNWDTIQFAQYVKNRDKKDLIILARDHGGPWQHPLEIARYQDIRDAMESAKLSFTRDIEAGFQILHIDPVINNAQETPSIDWILDKIFDLYDFTMSKARELGRNIHFEIGTEEQTQNPLKEMAALEEVIQRLKVFCEKRNYPFPIYMVVQTGTKVMETKNIGLFPRMPADIEPYLKQNKIREIVHLCKKNGLRIKQHNTDYLSDESLRVHPLIGIHAANIAPEFGVAETDALIQILKQLGLDNELQSFIDLAVNSGKWFKWAIDPAQLSDFEKARICGHYVFSVPEFLEIKRVVENHLRKSGQDLDEVLKTSVKKSILRYVQCFGC